MDNSKFIPSVRFLNGLRIYFKSKTAIQVSQGDYHVDIIRWDQVGNGRYSSSWKPFCEKLCRANYFSSIHQVIRLANRYDLRSYTSKHPVDPPPGIWVRPSKYRWPRKENHGSTKTARNNQAKRARS